MKKKCIAFRIIILSLFMSAQIYCQAKYFNGFQYYISDKKDTDSACYYAEKLAKANIKTFRILIHESFIQYFLPEKSAGKNNFEKELLNKMLKSQNRQMVAVLKPLSFLSEAADASGKQEKMKLVVDGFAENELKSLTGCGDRVERYALLIYKLAAKEKGCAEAADSILFISKRNLEKYLKTNLPAEDRAWCRYLLAYCNYVLAEKAVRAGDNKSASVYYREASDYSPDVKDKNYSYYYFYDKAFLLNADKQESFKDYYIGFLKNSNKSETLRVLTEKAVLAPKFVKELRDYYKENMTGGEEFNKYWEREFNKALTEAPAFSIKNKDGSGFRLEDYKGRWLFIDFWGTWCSVCVEEFPEVQKFYLGMSSEYSNLIKVITIANNTTFENAKDFMKKNNYTVPFFIADGNPERLYNVNSFPTKILITPQGKYIKIPSGEKWADEVKSYMGIIK